jgi:ribosomal protein S18 acetylase RimI-like enzyme
VGRFPGTEGTPIPLRRAAPIRGDPDHPPRANRVDQTPTSVRDARPEELDEVSGLLLQAYGEYAPLLGPERWERYGRNLADLASQLGHADLIVVEHGGRLVGFAMLYPDGSLEEAGSWPAGWAAIRRVGVRPEARGRGIGELLMRECLRRARALGIAVVGLHTTTAMAAARRLYERMGFTRVEEMDREVGPGTVLMAYRFDI